MDIIAKIESGGHQAFRTGAPDEWLFSCPNCGKKKVAVNSDSGKWRCLVGCGKGGPRRLFKFLGVPWPGDEPTLIELRRSIRRIPTQALALAPDTHALPEEYQPLIGSSGTTARRVWTYLLGRGVRPEDSEIWRLGYCDEGVYAGYLIIPIFGLRGDIVSFQARQVIGDTAKSLNPSGSADYLYGIHFAQAFSGLIVVEGPFDVQACYRQVAGDGIGSVGLLGHECSAPQAAMIGRVLRPKIVWILLDPDVSDRDRHKVGWTIRQEGVDDVRIGDIEQDPDETCREDLLDAFDSSVPCRPSKLMQRLTKQ